MLLLVAGCNSLLGIDDFTLVDAAQGIDAQTTYVVREGLNGYALTQDTYIETTADAAHGEEPDLHWTTTGTTHLLLRFDDLFGAGGIPIGATIQTATLQLTVIEAGSGMGRLYESAVDWTEATTSSTFGPMPGVTFDDRGTQLDLFDATQLGTASINVTTSLQRWRANPANNRGWLLVPAEAALARVGSSENTIDAQRPTLTVEIVPAN